MAVLEIDDHSVEIDLVVFDKDGTLIDLHRLWGERTRRCAAWLAEHADRVVDSVQAIRVRG